VVTVDAAGRGVITADAPAPAVHDLGGGMSVVDLWKTRQTPCDLSRRDDAPEAGALSLTPPPGGSVFRIANFPPQSTQGTSATDAKRIFEAMGAAEASTADADARNSLMHRTDTIDYGIVLEGEIIMLVDDGEVQLRAGDVVIQRGANHGWVNRSGLYCRMAFVLIDARK
jgi:mannose-6-phosphate isomerase-like protein (cupin superfamily)